MTPTPQKLTLEMIEAAVAINTASLKKHPVLRKKTDTEVRIWVMAHQDECLDMLTAASKHTGADDLAEALGVLIDCSSSDDAFGIDEALASARATLAKHRAIVGRV